jgi:CRISPR/Cas system-associated exonuclease Cas4 (RecB family)
VEPPTPASRELNPAQAEVLRQLGATPGERPTFDAGLRHELKAELEIALSHLAESLPDDDILFVGKRQLGQIMGCEAHYLADLEEEFEWSTPVARGVLAHKAIELSVFWSGPVDPLTLTDETIARMEQDTRGVGHWLQGITEADRAELRGEVNNRVGAFLETWPPLERRWRPMLEAPVRVEIAQGNIVLAGKVDLALGRAEGNTAGKVIVDLKTGRFSPGHRDDLRYYALLDTIRVGTPPRLTATYYLDQGAFAPEAVTVPVLEAALARVCDAVHRIVEVRYQGREADVQPGPSCRWCPKLDSCLPGQRHLSIDDELNDVLEPDPDE